MSSILIVAGEKSGERYGAGLIREFKRLHPDAVFFGIGGSAMAAEGADLLYSIQDLALVGIFEILTHIPRLLRIRRNLLRETENRKPNAAVLIDSPDFNLRLARCLKRRTIPVLYYISPTVWAWRKSRLRAIRRLIRRMLLIFPFEKKIYREADVPATYVGHPLIETLPVPIGKRDAAREFGFDPERPLVACLPGSRASEVRFHMPILMQAVRRLILTHGVGCALILADNLDREMVVRMIPKDIQGSVLVLPHARSEVLSAADVALSACGTANLEAALMEVPTVAFYRISPLTYALGKHLVKIRRFSIVNILAGRTLLPELIQKDFTSNNLVRETERILDSNEVRNRMKSAFREIRRSLGDRAASRESARQLDGLLRETGGAAPRPKPLPPEA